MYEFLDVETGSYSITVSKAEYTDLVDDYVIDVREGKKVRRDVQIQKRPAFFHLYDNENHEISELDFGADGGVTKKTFNIFNGGTQNMDFTIEKSVDWISNISQASGTIIVNKTIPIVITIDRGLLSAGDNITTLLITSSVGGGRELTVKARKNGETPTVTISEAIAIETTTYRIKCDVVSSGGQEVVERGICWNTFGDPTLDDETIQYSSGGLGQYTIRMENLSVSKRYYVRAYAKNAMGTGFSRVVDFKPGVVGTLPTVSTEALNGITTTSVTCIGKVIDDGGVGLVDCGVCWGLSNNPDLNGSHQSADEPGMGLFSVFISGLTPNTTYHVRCYASNTQGVSYGDELTFVTTEGLPTVTTAGVSNITATSAMGGGNVVDEGSSHVTERGICWGTTHNPTVSGSHVVNGSGTGSFTVNMTGLTAGTTYYVRAYAVNDKGTSYGSEESFTTAAPSLPTVSTAAVTGIGETSATGGGNVTGDGGVAVTERGICWNTNHNPTTANAHSSNGTGTGNFTVTMNGLSAGTTYYVRAYAVNNAGTAYGNEVVFSTQHGDWPDGTLPGGFSINALQQVHFSQGNLQYRAYTNTWRFAQNQYDFIGNNNSNISQTYSGWIDLFGWATSGWNSGYYYNYQPYSSYCDYNYHSYGPTANLTGSFANADWGVYNSISNGGNRPNMWRTLNKEEMVYLFELRETPSGIRFALAKVNNVKGLLLLPDDWDASIYPLQSCNQTQGFTINEISITDWIVMENNGAVFFPAAGKREGTWMEYVGESGGYWTSTYMPYSDNSVSPYAFCLNFSHEQWNGYPSIDWQGIDNGSFGRSVRLVRVVQ